MGRTKLLILVFLMVQVYAYPQYVRSFCIKGDTLISNIGCGDTIRGFLSIKNVNISRDYSLLDSIRININASEHLLVIILSPVLQEKYVGSKCYYHTRDKRLLALLKWNGKQYKIQDVNDDIVLNRHEYQSDPYRKVERSKEGFVLKFFTGSSEKCYYDFYFKKSKNKYCLSKSYRNCYLIDLSKKSEKIISYPLGKYPIDKINIRNFIKTASLKGLK